MRGPVAPAPPGGSFFFRGKPLFSIRRGLASNSAEAVSGPGSGHRPSPIRPLRGHLPPRGSEGGRNYIWISAGASVVNRPLAGLPTAFPLAPQKSAARFPSGNRGNAPNPAPLRAPLPPGAAPAPCGTSCAAAEKKRAWAKWERHRSPERVPSALEAKPCRWRPDSVSTFSKPFQQEFSP